MKINQQELKKQVESQIKENDIEKSESIIGQARLKIKGLVLPTLMQITLMTLILVNGTRIEIDAKVFNNLDEGDKNETNSENKSAGDISFEEFIEIEDNNNAPEEKPKSQGMYNDGEVAVDILNDRGLLRVHLANPETTKKLGHPQAIFVNANDESKNLVADMRGRIPNAELILSGFLDDNREGDISVLVIDANDPSTGGVVVLVSKQFKISEKWSGVVNYDNLVDNKEQSINQTSSLATTIVD